MNKLKKDEKNILYHVYKKKYMTDYKPFRITDLISDLIVEYNEENIIDAINSLVSKEFIIVKIGGVALPVDQIQSILKPDNHPEIIDGLELCAPNVEKFNDIKKLLIYRRSEDWLSENITLTWQFIWKHFIVTIIVSALTTYIITKYITNS